MLIQMSEIKTWERKSSYLILHAAILHRILRAGAWVRKTLETGSGDAFKSCEVLLSLFSLLAIL